MSGGRPPHETKWPGCEGVPVPLPTKLWGDVQRCRDRVVVLIRLEEPRSTIVAKNLVYGVSKTFSVVFKAAE